MAQPSIDFLRQHQVVDHTRRLVGFTGPLDNIPGEIGKWTTFVEGGMWLLDSLDEPSSPWFQYMIDDTIT